MLLMVEDVKQNLGKSQDSLMLVFEANRIILPMYKASYLFRAHQARAFALTDVQMAHPWTCSEPLILMLQHMFDFTDRALAEYCRLHNVRIGNDDDVDMAEFDSGPNPESVASNFKSQLVELCDVYTATYLEFVATTPKDESESKTMTEQYHQIQSQQLSVLAGIHMVDQALELAEKSRNFHAWVNLVFEYKQKPELYLQDCPLLQKYPNDFPQALFNFLDRKGEQKILFSLPPEYDDSLIKYLSERQSDLLWLILLRRKDYKMAFESMMAYGGKVQSIEAKEILYSMAKLSAVAANKSVDVEQNMEVDAACMNLDFCAIFDGYRNMLLATISVEQDDPVHDEAIVDRLLKMVATGVRQKRPNCLTYLKALFTALLAKRSIHLSDLVDAMTLNFSDDQEDPSRFGLAMELFTFVGRKLPDQYETDIILRTIVRRTLLACCNKLAQIQKMVHARVAEEIRGLAIFHVLQAARSDLGVQYGSVDELKFARTHADFRRHAQGSPILRKWSAQQLDHLYDEFEMENNLLDMHVRQNGLAEIYQELLEQSQQ